MMWPFSLFQKKKETREQKSAARYRNYSSASVSRLSEDFLGAHSSIETDLRASLRRMRDRCRDAYRNNGYIRRYVKLCRSNIVGPQGFLLKNKAKLGSDKPDKRVNKLIEDAWWEWCKRCDITGKLSFREVCNLVVSCKKIDGEAVVIRHMRGNKMCLEVCDPDRLDETYDRIVMQNGNRIALGVEIDPHYRPIAYHILDSHPTDYSTNRFKRYRYPASRVYHVFEQERPGQVRGVPEIQAAILDLHQLDGYKQAELTAARIAASKMGFYTSDGSDTYSGENRQTDGALIDEVSPGQFVDLPPGKQFTPFNPEHPVTAFGQFVDACLRIAASALGISYSALANDISKANYSSMRQDALMDRDNWQTEQQFLIESFVTPVFMDWLERYLLSSVDIPLSQFDRVCQPVFRGRGWAWVDPLKEINAHKVAIEARIKSRESILAETGDDVEELFADLKNEAELARIYGIDLATQPGGQNATEREDDEEIQD